MQSKIKNIVPTEHEIARLKNVGMKFESRLERKEQMLADGIINKMEYVKNFVIPKSEPIIFLIIFILSRHVITKQIPKPQIKAFIPINFGKNQIDKIKRTAPKI